MLGKKEKLIKRLKACPKDFTFEELETLLKYLGFSKSNKGRTSGSRVSFIRDSISINLHKPHTRKELLVVQVKQVLAILEREGIFDEHNEV